MAHKYLQLFLIAILLISNILFFRIPLTYKISRIPLVGQNLSIQQILIFFIFPLFILFLIHRLFNKYYEKADRSFSHLSLTHINIFIVGFLISLLLASLIEFYNFILYRELNVCFLKLLTILIYNFAVIEINIRFEKGILFAETKTESFNEISLNGEDFFLYFKLKEYFQGLLLFLAVDVIFSACGEKGNVFVFTLLSILCGLVSGLVYAVLYYLWLC